MQKVLKKKITTLIVMCSMILTVVAFPVAVSAHYLTFQPGPGAHIGTLDPEETFEFDTGISSPLEYVSGDVANLVFGASKEGYRLKCWNIAGTTGQQISFYDVPSLCAHKFTSDTTLTAEWLKSISVTLYNKVPNDENAKDVIETAEGFTITEDWIHKEYPDRDGYTVIGLEYAGKGGTRGNQYVYDTQIYEDTELKLRWKKVDVPDGGGGGSDSDTPTKSDPSGGGGGGGVPNPKTGDLGVVTYVGIIAVSALGTAGVVKLLKKEK